MNRVFASALSGYITRFVEQKHALGFPYIDSGRIVSNFDKFCAEYYPREQTITEEMGLHWATIRKTEGKKGICTRVGVVQELARLVMYGNSWRWDKPIRNQGYVMLPEQNLDF